VPEHLSLAACAICVARSTAGPSSNGSSAAESSRQEAQEPRPDGETAAGAGRAAGSPGTHSGAPHWDPIGLQHAGLAASEQDKEKWGSFSFLNGDGGAPLPAAWGPGTRPRDARNTIWPWGGHSGAARSGSTRAPCKGRQGRGGALVALGPCLSSPSMVSLKVRLIVIAWLAKSVVHLVHPCRPPASSCTAAHALIRFSPLKNGFRKSSFSPLATCVRPVLRVRVCPSMCPCVSLSLPACPCVVYPCVSLGILLFSCVQAPGRMTTHRPVSTRLAVSWLQPLVHRGPSLLQPGPPLRAGPPLEACSPCTPPCSWPSLRRTPRPPAWGAPPRGPWRTLRRPHRLRRASAVPTVTPGVHAPHYPRSGLPLQAHPHQGSCRWPAFSSPRRSPKCRPKAQPEVQPPEAQPKEQQPKVQPREAPSHRRPLQSKSRRAEAMLRLRRMTAAKTLTWPVWDQMASGRGGSNGDWSSCSLCNKTTQATGLRRQQAFCPHGHRTVQKGPADEHEWSS